MEGHLPFQALRLGVNAHAQTALRAAFRVEEPLNAAGKVREFGDPKRTHKAAPKKKKAAKKQITAIASNTFEIVVLVSSIEFPRTGKDGSYVDRTYDMYG